MEKTCIFVSYSHRDDRWVQAGQYGLVPWLADQLRRFGAEFWYDPELRKLPGEAYKDRIHSEIDASQFALLLISQNFIGSEFICRYELPWIKDRLEKGELSIIPVLVGPTDWEHEEELRWLSERQMLPGKPTPLIDYIDSPAKWEHVQQEIFTAIKSRIIKYRNPAPPPPKKPAPVR